MLYRYENARLKPLMVSTQEALHVSAQQGTLLVSNRIEEMTSIVSYSHTAFLIHTKNRYSLFRFCWLQWKARTRKEFRTILYAAPKDWLYYGLKCASVLSFGYYHLIVLGQQPVAKKRIIWLVGASSGIGLELTKRWLHEGHRLIASSRNATSSSELLSLQANYPKTLHLLDCDVSQAGDFSSIVAQAWQTYGRIDRWFYNAGAYEVMKMDAWDVTAFDTMAQTNYLGAVRLMVPLSHYCVQQGHGEWVWNASLSSYFGLPYGGGYSAPKAALLNLAESIYPELLTKGITLRVINHGFVKTRLTAKNSFTMPELMSPYEAAEQIARHLEAPRGFEIRFPFKLSAFLSLLRILPYRLSLWLTQKAL